MRPAAIATLLIIVSCAGAGLSQQVGATPRQEADGMALRPVDAAVLARKIATFGIRRVAIADPDLDGVVSAAEAQHYYSARFALMDRDRDRRLSEAEFFRAAMSQSLQALDGSLAARPLGFEAVHAERGSALAPDGLRRAAGVWRSWAGDPAPDAGRRSVFEAIDADGDGAIGKEEFLRAGLRQFSASDADGDGRVTLWEFYRGKRL